MVYGLPVAEFEKYSEEWLDDLLRRGKAKPTARIYRWAVETLLPVAREVGSVNREALDRWQDRLLKKGMTSRTRSLAGTAIRRFLFWAVERDLCDARLPLAVPAPAYLRRKLPSPLDRADVRKIEDYLAQPPFTVHHLRDRALFNYVLATAAPVSEILGVRKRNFEHAVVRKVGGGERVLHAPPKVAALIQAYLDRRGTDDLDALWIGWRRGGEPMALQDSGIAKVWERIAHKAKVPVFSTRELRHTAGTRLAELGYDIESIQEHLGARDVRTVQGYIRIAKSARMERVQAALDVGAF